MKIPFFFVSSRQEIWQQQSRKHPLLVGHVVVAVIVVLCGKNHWQLEHTKNNKIALTNHSFR